MHTRKACPELWLKRGWFIPLIPRPLLPQGEKGSVASIKNVRNAIDDDRSRADSGDLMGRVERVDSGRRHCPPGARL